MSSLFIRKLMSHKISNINMSHDELDLLNRIRYLMTSKRFDCKLLLDIAIQESYYNNSTITSVLDKIDNIIIKYYGKDKSNEFNNYIKSKLSK